MSRKLLLHQCCAVCSASFFERIPSAFAVAGFWFNPNIAPCDESLRRKDALRAFNSMKGVETISAEPDVPVATGVSSGLPRPLRCRDCYKTRMDETARFAAVSGFGAFSTTLLASPRQEHELARAAAEASAEKFRVAFVYIDTRDIYYDGKRFASSRGLYSQKYCGCLASLAERSLPSVKRPRA